MGSPFVHSSLLLALVGAGGCSLLFDAGSDGGPAGEVADASSDGSPDFICTERGPDIPLPVFDMPTTILGNWGDRDTWLGALSADESVIAVHHYDPDTLTDIYTATKGQSGSFLPTTLWLETDDPEQPVFMERDGAALWFVSETSDIGDIYRAEVGNRQAVPFSLNDSDVHQSWLWLSLDQERAYYLSDRSLSRASKVGATFVFDDQFGNLDGSIRSFTMSCDEREVIFQKDDSGDADLFWATRDSLEEPFSDPIFLDSINTDMDEAHPWLSVDGQRLYLDYNADLSGEILSNNNAGVQMATRQP